MCGKQTSLISFLRSVAYKCTCFSLSSRMSVSLSYILLNEDVTYYIKASYPPVVFTMADCNWLLSVLWNNCGEDDKGLVYL